MRQIRKYLTNLSAWIFTIIAVFSLTTPANSIESNSIIPPLNAIPSTQGIGREGEESWKKELRLRSVYVPWEEVRDSVAEKVTEEENNSDSLNSQLETEDQPVEIDFPFETFISESLIRIKQGVGHIRWLIGYINPFQVNYFLLYPYWFFVVGTWIRSCLFGLVHGYTTIFLVWGSCKMFARYDWGETLFVRILDEIVRPVLVESTLWLPGTGILGISAQLFLIILNLIGVWIRTYISIVYDTEVDYRIREHVYTVETQYGKLPTVPNGNVFGFRDNDLDIAGYHNLKVALNTQMGAVQNWPKELRRDGITDQKLEMLKKLMYTDDYIIPKVNYSKLEELCNDYSLADKGYRKTLMQDFYELNDLLKAHEHLHPGYKLPFLYRLKAPIIGGIRNYYRKLTRISHTINFDEWDPPKQTFFKRFGRWCHKQFDSLQVSFTRGKDAFLFGLEPEEINYYKKMGFGNGEIPFNSYREKNLAVGLFDGRTTHGLGPLWLDKPLTLNGSNGVINGVIESGSRFSLFNQQGEPLMHHPERLLTTKQLFGSGTVLEEYDTWLPYMRVFREGKFNAYVNRLGLNPVIKQPDMHKWHEPVGKFFMRDFEWGGLKFSKAIVMYASEITGLQFDGLNFNG